MAELYAALERTLASPMRLRRVQRSALCQALFLASVLHAASAQQRSSYLRGLGGSKIWQQNTLLPQSTYAKRWC